MADFRGGFQRRIEADTRTLLRVDHTLAVEEEERIEHFFVKE